MESKPQRRGWRERGLPACVPGACRHHVCGGEEDGGAVWKELALAIDQEGGEVERGEF